MGKSYNTITITMHYNAADEQDTFRAMRDAFERVIEGSPRYITRENTDRAYQEAAEDVFSCKQE